MANRIFNDAYEAMDRIFGAEQSESAESEFYDLLNQVSIAVVEYRMKHDLSQSELAKCLGISQAMVSKYESGDYNFSIKALFELMHKLDISFHLEINCTDKDYAPNTNSMSYDEIYSNISPNEATEAGIESGNIDDEMTSAA